MLRGEKTWVGYAKNTSDLPRLKASIIMPNGAPIIASQSLPEQSIQAINYWYAKEYNWTKDVRILLKGYRWLGA